MPNGKDNTLCYVCIALIDRNAHDQNNHTPFSCNVKKAEQFRLPFVPICQMVMRVIYYSFRLHAQLAVPFMTHDECCMLLSNY